MINLFGLASVLLFLTFGTYLPCTSGGVSAAVLPAASATPSTGKAAYDNYRGIKVGISQADARAKLGDSSQRSNAGDFYTFSPTETAQVLYDKEQTVKSITVNYSGNLKAAPQPKDILGEDVKKAEDGSIYKLVRYPSEGFWVSYNRTAGSDAMVVVTLQKMPRE